MTRVHHAGLGIDQGMRENQFTLASAYAEVIQKTVLAYTRSSWPKLYPPQAQLGDSPWAHARCHASDDRVLSHTGATRDAPA